VIRLPFDRKWLALPGLLLVAMPFGCIALEELFWSRGTIADVNVRQQLVLRSSNPQPDSFSIVVEGHIEGIANIQFCTQSHWIGPGPVNLRSSLDWYDPSCPLLYFPHGTVQEELKILYRFH
jgi:hypothetical protein